jgi:hypothetical protein
LSNTALKWAKAQHGYKSGPSRMLVELSDAASDPGQKLKMPPWAQKAYRGEDFVSWAHVQTLARTCGCTDRAAQNHLDLLEATGAIKRRKCYDKVRAGTLYFVQVGTTIDFAAFAGMPGIRPADSANLRADFSGSEAPTTGKKRPDYRKNSTPLPEKSSGIIEEPSDEPSDEPSHTEQASPGCAASHGKDQALPFTAEDVHAAAVELWGMWDEKFRGPDFKQVLKNLPKVCTIEKREPADFVAAASGFLRASRPRGISPTWIAVWLTRATEYRPHLPPRKIDFHLDAWVVHMRTYAQAGTWDQDELGAHPGDRRCSAPFEAYQVVLWETTDPKTGERLMRAVKGRFNMGLDNEWDRLERLRDAFSDFRWRDGKWPAGQGLPPNHPDARHPPFLYVAYGIPLPGATGQRRPAAAE